MINSPTHILAARLQTIEGFHDVLEHMDQQHAIELEDIYQLIRPDESYFVIHNIRIDGNMGSQSRVQGDALNIFIQDYIEPAIGDGLDMHVFPEDGAWCLIFDIDGGIVFRSRD